MGGATQKKTAVRKASKPVKAKGLKAAKVPPGSQAVAGRVLEVTADGNEPVLWKEAELKRRLAAAERPVLAAALELLRAERRVLALPQGRATLYLFAEPLRAWLAEGAETGAPKSGKTSADAIFAAYMAAVRRSGGFPDVKISSLELADAGESLKTLWREGRATFSQGDWSLADEATRAAAVEVNGEQYLLVRLEDEAES